MPANSGVEWLRGHRFDKIAVLTSTVYIKHFVNMLVYATGLAGFMHVFKSEKEAMDWLWMKK